MALDTRNRRASAIGLGLIFLRVLPVPDGTIEARDRRQTALCYSGLDASSTSSASTALESWALEKELAGEGNGWTDVSGDVRGAEPIVVDYGIPDNTPAARVAAAGALTYALNNSEFNSAGTAGYYSPLHASKRSGFTYNIGTRLKLVYDGSTRYKFRGKLADILPEPGRYGPRLTHCRALDWMDDAARLDVPDLDAQTNKRGDELITLILDALTVQPAARDLDIGLETFTYALDGATGQKIKTREELIKIALSEYGAIYMKGDETQGGTLKFENRTRRSLEPDTLFTLDNDMVRNGLVVPGSRDDVYSIVQVFFRPTRVDTAATTVLFSLQTAQIQLAPGESNSSIFGPYRDPTTNDPIGGTATVDPVATTDYLANSQADGLGSNLTADLTVVASRTGQGVRFTLTNGGASTLFVTKLQVRGKGIYRYNAVVEESVVGSFGDRPLEINMPYLTNVNTATDIARHLANILANPFANVQSVTFLANKSAAFMAAAVNLEPGDRVAISEAITGLAVHQFTINRVRLELHRAGLIWCTWGLEPASTQFSWLLGVVGSSELGETTTLGF